MLCIRSSLTQCDSVSSTKDLEEIEDVSKEYYICDKEKKRTQNQQSKFFTSSYPVPHSAKRTCIHIRTSKSPNQTNKTQTTCLSKNTLDVYTNDMLHDEVITPRFRMSQRIRNCNNTRYFWTQCTCGGNMFSKNEKVNNVIL